MFQEKKKITIELNKNNKQTIVKNIEMTNPIKNDYSGSDTLSLMVMKVLNEEFPKLKNNSLLYDLVLYSLKEKMNTIQNVRNVVSCIKENHGTMVDDVSFKNGEVFIKCSI